MLAFLGLTAGLVLGADPQFSYDASVRGELRVGNALPFVVTQEVGTELGVTPSLTLVCRHARTYLFSLQYDPQFLLPLNVSGIGVEVLHQGRALADWGKPNGSERYTVSEDFQYGITDFVSLTSTTSTLTPQLQPLPLVTRVNYVYSNSKADIAFRLAPKLRLTATGGYQLSGGADTAAQVVFPLQQGPYLELLLHDTLSTKDALETDLILASASFSSGPLIFIGGVTEGWIRRLYRYFNLELTGGISTAFDSPSRQLPYVVDVFPIARVTGTETRPTSRTHILHGSLLLEVAPYVDRISGAAYERTQALLNFDWTAQLGFGARLQGGYARPLYGNLVNAQVVELLGSTLAYQPETFLRFEVGISGVWQQPLPGAPGPMTFQWLGIGSVLLRSAGPL